MPATWPVGVPSKVLRAGVSLIEGERAARSDTDSGLARQKNVFSVAPNGIAGNIPMTLAQYETFRAWRQSLGGGSFNWPGHPSGGTVLSRFVAGEQGETQPNPATAKYLVPVRIEYL